MEYEKQLHYYVAMTESVMDVLLGQSEAPEILQKSMEYSVNCGGKRLRPVLCLAVCDLMGGATADAIKAACAIEMIHTYSLIHDDLPAMDNDDFRRGKPSCHKAFGEGNAILAGDGLLTHAFYVLSQTGSAKVIKTVARCAMDMVCGQSLDINETSRPEVLFELMAKKTGALIKAAVLCGAYCSGNPELSKHMQALTVFADNFGLLFQITDDVLDYLQDSSQDEGKLTFVSLYGIEPAREQAAMAAKAAKDALATIGSDTEFLTEIVDRMLYRTR